MPQHNPEVDQEVERYLRTGETDAYAAAWAGQNLIESTKIAHDDLIGALIASVKERSAGQAKPHTFQDPVNLGGLTRNRVEPMVRGLFPRAEHEPVMALVEHSVVFLTSANIEATLLDCRWLHTAWDIANLYLGSLGVELLSEEAPCLVGLSEETTCFVSLHYFDEQDPFADFVVHEVAHIFHNCKRESAGLRDIRGREWLLEIGFRRRETFDYACETYSTIAKRGRSLHERVALAEDFGRNVRIADDRVDPKELADIIQEACDRRNGWKAILARCSPPKARKPRKEPATAAPRSFE
jgi:hypothetical protein